MNINRLKLQ